MSKICCVILNYNDADTARTLLHQIEHYQGIDTIILVDNASTDDSYIQLLPFVSDHIHLLQSKSNGGYASGNNIGIRYAIQTLQATHVLIANPDVAFCERLVLDMAEILNQTARAALISAKVKSPQGSDLFCCWKRFHVWGDLLDSGLITRRLFKRWLNYSPEMLHQAPYCEVDAVPGSLIMIDTQYFPDSDVFDEHVFLYYEEKILGAKLKELGLKTLLYTEKSYIHAHSISIDKSIGSALRKQKILHKSKLYYYKNYLNAGHFTMLTATIFLTMVLAEVWILTPFFQLNRWKGILCQKKDNPS